MKAHKVFRELGEARAKLEQFGVPPLKTELRKRLGTVQVMEMGCGRRGGNGDARQRQVYRKRGMTGNDIMTLSAMTGRMRAKNGMHGEPKLHVPQRAA
jgi:hypothetical protein